MTRRICIVFALLLVLAACSSSGEPTGFDQQPEALGDELGEAMGLPADTVLPVVEKNFLEGCVLADTPRIAGGSNTPAACECAYDAIVTFYLERAEDQGAEDQGAEDVSAEAYSLFRNLNNDLAGNPRPLPADVLNAVDEAGCTA